MLLASCERNDAVPPPKQSNQTNGLIEDSINKKRASIGLRVIDVNWFLYRSLPTQDDWKIHKDGFLAKSVFKKLPGDVLSEEDYYYSGAQFYDLEGHGWECITVHYDYGKKDIVLSYTGTNAATKTILSKYLMSYRGPATNVSAVMDAVRKAAAGWPDAPY
jgi:hypothetical protein